MSFGIIKKRSEKEFADFFIERFNRHYNLDYVTRSNEDESGVDGDIDIYAVSTGREILNIQVKTGEPALEFFWGLIRKFKKSMEMINDFNIENQLSDIINKAEQKYFSKDKLILLIGEKMQPTFDGKYVKMISSPYANSGFRGIYLAKLPFGSADSPYEGQVVAIKDIFGNNGEIF